MQVYRSLAEIPSDFGPSVVTIGKFNGVHIGHQAMIRQAVAIGQPNNLPVVVVTFDRHPAALFAPDRVPADITGLERRIDLCRLQGAEVVVVLEFDHALASLSPSEFVQQVVVDGLHAQHVVVGEDFRFGSKAAGSVDTLVDLGRERGFSVTVVADVAPDGSRRVSSSWIRELLESGDIRTANELLGRRHAVRGTVVHGEARGRLLGYPTANLGPDSTGYLPGDATYVGWPVSYTHLTLPTNREV